MAHVPSVPCPSDPAAPVVPATLAQDLLAGASDAILALDPDGRVLFWNRGAELLFGWSSQEMHGQPATRLLPADRVEELERVAAVLRGTDEVAAMETVRLHKSGELLPVSCRMSPLVDSTGKVYGTSAVVRDNSRETALREQLEQARQLAEARFTESVVAQASMSPDGTVIAVNPRLCQVSGYHEKDLLGRSFLEFLAPDELEEALPRLQPGLTGAMCRSQYHRRLRHASGELLDAQVSLFTVTSSDGHVTRLEAVLEDVTGAVAAQRTLALSEAKWQSLAMHSSDVALLADTDAVIQFASASVTGQFGYQPDQLVGADGFSYFHPQDVQRVRAEWGAVVRDPARTGTFEARIRHADGTWRWVENIVSNKIAAAGIHAMVANILDITDRKNAEAVLQELAGQDGLTGLPTRAPLLAAIDAALAHPPDNGMALAVLDLDRFKVVNATHGHQVGDEALTVIADRLRQPGSGARAVARLGGDRFAVLLDADDPAAPLADRVASLQAALAAPIRIGGIELAVSTTTGVAHGPVDDSSWLLTAAEAALEQAKIQAVGSLMMRAAQSTSAAMERALLVEDLRRALAAEEMIVHFQPVLSLSTGRVAAAEALVRWQHPTRGLLPPATFIDAAEDSGLIVALGKQVLRQACDQAARWARLPDVPYFHVAVNLSAKQLTAPDVVDVVRDCLRDSGAAAGNLMLEVTESAVMSDIDATSRTLEQLRALGLAIAVDDFGTGYSSLTYLKRFPVTCLKIDRSFVAGLGQDDQDAAIVASVLNLARSLGLDCIAEGIETDEHRLVLQALGCPLGQGYLWSAAIDPEAFDSWLTTNLAASAPPASPAPRTPYRATAPTSAVARRDSDIALNQMKSMLTDGASLHTIVAALNLAGLRTPAGKRWSVRSVAQSIALEPIDRTQPSTTIR